MPTPKPRAKVILHQTKVPKQRSVAIQTQAFWNISAKHLDALKETGYGTDSIPPYLLGWASAPFPGPRLLSDRVPGDHGEVWVSGAWRNMEDP